MLLEKYNSQEAFMDNHISGQNHTAGLSAFRGDLS